MGPIYRFRKTIQAVTAGEPVRLIKLREGDYLLEMKDELNALLTFLQQRGLVTLVEPGDGCERFAVRERSLGPGWRTA